MVQKRSHLSVASFPRACACASRCDGTRATRSATRGVGPTPAAQTQNPYGSEAFVERDRDFSPTSLSTRGYERYKCILHNMNNGLLTCSSLRGMIYETT